MTYNLNYSISFEYSNMLVNCARERTVLSFSSMIWSNIEERCHYRSLFLFILLPCIVTAYNAMFLALKDVL